jgi:hypothetical protein
MPRDVIVPFTSDDLLLAFELLWGSTAQENDGVFRTKYLKPGSEAEKKARAALARVLVAVAQKLLATGPNKNSLEIMLLIGLADLFDERRPSRNVGPRRTVKFSAPRGKQLDPIKTSQIVGQVEARLRATGGKHKGETYAAVAKDWLLSKRQVERQRTKRPPTMICLVKTTSD